MPAAIAVAASTRTDAAPPPPQALDANQPSSGLPSAASRFSVGRLHVVAHRAVDVARREAGVGTGGEDRLERHVVLGAAEGLPERRLPDRKSTRLNSSHDQISYAVFCLNKKKYILHPTHRDSK